MADRHFHCDDIACFVAHRDPATKCLASHEPQRYGFVCDGDLLICPKHLPRRTPDKKPHWRWPKTRTADEAAMVKHLKAARSTLNAAAVLVHRHEWSSENQSLLDESRLGLRAELAALESVIARRPEPGSKRHACAQRHHHLGWVLAQQDLR